MMQRSCRTITRVVKKERERAIIQTVIQKPQYSDISHVWITPMREETGGKGGREGGIFVGWRKVKDSKEKQLVSSVLLK